MALHEGSAWTDIPRRISTCVIVVLLSTISYANPTEVYWSGYAYQGEWSAAKDRYPFSYELAMTRSKDGKQPFLDERLGQKLGGFKNDSFDIVFEKGSIGPDAASSIALAFVLDRETVSVEMIGGLYKIIVELSAQALFFDFKERVVVASYPISQGIIHAQEREPTSEDKAAFIKNLYVGVGKANVFDEFVKTLANAELNTFVNRRIQVADVSVNPAVLENLPEFWRNNPKDFASFLAQEFGRSLSKNQNVPVLPYTKGHAIGGRMSASFAEGEAFDLVLPEPDYIVSLDLKKLVKIEYAKVAAGTSYIYGAYMGVIASEPLSGRTYLDTTIKNGEVKIVPATQTYIDDWPAYQDSLLGLFHKFTTEISSPSKEWAKKHVGDAAARKQLSAFGKVVLSCR